MAKYDAAKYNRADLDTSFSRVGFHGELAVNLAGFVQVGGLYEDAGRPERRFAGSVAILPKLDVIKASAYYLRKT